MIYTVTLNPAVDKELVVPALEMDTVLRSQEINIDYGGKGFNVSRMLKALGSCTVALGFAGGNNGRLLRDGLESLGIESDFVWVDGETRTNVSIVTEVPSHYIKVNEPGPVISMEAREALIEKVRALARAGDWWVLAGSLPPGVPPTIYANLIQVIQKSGAHVVLDTSGEALRWGCSGRPFLAKPNDIELQQLTGLPVDSLAEIAFAAASMKESGIDNVVVSLGKDGAMLVDAEDVWQAAAPKIKERNPIGAGDSMVGGLVWGLSDGLSVPDALRWGIACGAATASMSGTAVGSRQLVEELHPRVKLTRFGDPVAAAPKDLKNK
ncbi:MAG: 1-phosphofructokinase [Candidatus Promineifilaceae bacterium]|nr:1-phosphofructokinase [Candidatus Promineifilaceae bacterium]